LRRASHNPHWIAIEYRFMASRRRSERVANCGRRVPTALDPGRESIHRARLPFNCSSLKVLCVCVCVCVCEYSCVCALAFPPKEGVSLPLTISVGEDLLEGGGRRKNGRTVKIICLDCRAAVVTHCNNWSKIATRPRKGIVYRSSRVMTSTRR
jgi:hypothetical protein